MNITKSALLSFIFTCFLFTSVYSQYDHSFFDAEKYDRVIDSSHISFHFDNLNYFRNTEYTTRVDKGSTFPGFHLLPYVQYQFNEDAEIMGGLFLRYDFGNPQIRTIEPYIKFKYRLWGHDLIFGNLEGSVQHNLIEPMMDYEQSVTKRMEQGIQVIRENKRIEYDFWIDWAQMIYQDDPKNEEMYAGLTLNLNPVLNEKTKLSLNGQGITVHQAGEIDLSVHPNSVIYNYAFGLRLDHKFSKNTAIHLAGHATFFHDLSDFTPFKYRNGKGYLAVARLKLHDYHIVMSYWDGYQYQAPYGERLYFSEGRKNVGDPYQNREMVSFRIASELHVAKNLTFLSRVGMNYNIDFQKADVIMENYLRWHFSTTPKKVSLN
ncbi:MAG: hypothetical protein JXR19_06520 [Bacteroidia bacterium]